MLILTRRIGDTLVIELPDGQEIRVTVTSLNGQQVRLGTEAPREIKVRREELPAKLAG